MRKFKIGDEVRIVNTDSMGKEYEATRGHVGVIVREPREGWAVQKYQDYLIRKEAKRRLAEMEQEKLDAEREKAIEAKMEEMQKAEKKNK